MCVPVTRGNVASVVAIAVVAVVVVAVAVAVVVAVAVGVAASVSRQTNKMVAICCFASYLDNDAINFLTRWLQENEFESLQRGI